MRTLLNGALILVAVLTGFVFLVLLIGWGAGMSFDGAVKVVLAVAVFLGFSYAIGRAVEEEREDVKRRGH